MLSEQPGTASQFVIWLLWLVSCGVAVWKWTKPVCRVPPFVVVGPVILGRGKPCDRSHIDEYCNGTLDCICLDG